MGVVRRQGTLSHLFAGFFTCEYISLSSSVIPHVSFCSISPTICWCMVSAANAFGSNSSLKSEPKDSRIQESDNEFSITPCRKTTTHHLYWYHQAPCWKPRPIIFSHTPHPTSGLGKKQLYIGVNKCKPCRRSTRTCGSYFWLNPNVGFWPSR